MALRGFCAACGTPLTYEGIASDKIEVTIGSLDNPAAAAPTNAFGGEGKMPWLEKAAALPAIETETKFAGLTSFQQPDRDS